MHSLLPPWAWTLAFPSPLLLLVSATLHTEQYTSPCTNLYTFSRVHTSIRASQTPGAIRPGTLRPARRLRCPAQLHGRAAACLLLRCVPCFAPGACPGPRLSALHMCACVHVLLAWVSTHRMLLHLYCDATRPEGQRRARSLVCTHPRGCEPFIRKLASCSAVHSPCKLQATSLARRNEPCVAEPA